MKTFGSYKIIIAFCVSVLVLVIVYANMDSNTSLHINSSYSNQQEIYYMRLTNLSRNRPSEHFLHELYDCSSDSFYINFTYSKDVDSLVEIVFDSDMSSKNSWFNSTPEIGLPRVLMSAESVLHTRCAQFEECANKFNWSSLSSLNVEFYSPYIKLGTIKPLLDTVGKFDYERDVMMVKTEYVDRFLENNTNIPIASWLANNCDTIETSNRLLYIKELMKHMPINSYGQCLNNAKKPNGSDDKLEIISKQKFYLSFENSNCKGYITEKPLHCLLAGTVPVLMGHPDNEFFLPRGSYIDVTNFNSAKELADYLIYLNQNEDEYQKYFDWRNDNKVIELWKAHLTEMPIFACDIAKYALKWRKGKVLSKIMDISDFKNDCLPYDFHKI